MREFAMPYHKTKMIIEVSDKNVAGVMSSNVKDYKPTMGQEEAIDWALDHPIGSPKLEELVKGKKNMVIITSDHTRGVPSKMTMPRLLKRIRSSNPQIDITILIATGLHRAPTEQEIFDRFGSEIVENEKIVVHDALDNDKLVQLGTLPSGGEVWLNKMAIEADLLISEGLIKPHPMAGFSGGRKSILPGIAGKTTVLANHCAEFVASDHARTGKLEGNPVHKDMIYAANEAKLAFTLNIIVNSKKEVINAFAGNVNESHLAGCNFIRGMVEVEKIEGDIVVCSNGGAPIDQNLYQLGKGMEAAELVCKPGGVIIMIAACNDGHGGQFFYDNLANASSAQEVYDRVLKVPRNETEFEQWAYQIFARVLTKFKMILVTDMCDPALIKGVHLDHALTFNEALEKAYSIKGHDASVVVIPDGGAIIIK
jgi:nickel-dependent lactate racemase